MLLSNWYKALKENMSGAAQTYVNMIGKTPTYTAPLSWMRFNASGQTNPYLGKIQTQYGGNVYGGVLFGTGNTEPTLEDYKLSGDVITGIEGTAIVSSKEDDDGSLTIECIYTITNGNSFEITISEIGVFGMGSSSYAGSSLAVLLDRTILDEPLTIPAGGLGQVTYTIRMNSPV